jgi:pteridine reductase
MKLAGKTAVITGGRRIGAALAPLLAERGMNVALAYHSRRDVADATATACQRHGVRTLAVAADLRDPQQAQHLIDETVQTLGAVDVLINLVSTYQQTSLETLTPASFLEQFDSSFSACCWAALAAARQMQQQPVVDGLQGKIIHFTDWAVDRPYRGYLPYLVAKGALATFTRTLAVELAPTITVNAIAPGTVEPPPHLTAEQREEIRQAAALQRIGSPDDVNRAVLYVLEGTDFVTGEVYRVDGGRFLGPASTPGG